MKKIKTIIIIIITVILGTVGWVLQCLANNNISLEDNLTLVSYISSPWTWSVLIVNLVIALISYYSNSRHNTTKNTPPKKDKIDNSIDEFVINSLKDLQSNAYSEEETKKLINILKRIEKFNIWRKKKRQK